MRQQHTQALQSNTYSLPPTGAANHPETAPSELSELYATPNAEPVRLDAASEQITSSAADIMALLQKEAVSRQKEALFTSFYILLSFLPVFYMVHVAALEYAAIHRQFLVWALLSLFSIGVLFWAAFRRSRRQKTFLARELGKPHDTTTAGPLIDALKIDNMQTRDLTKRALTGLLPRLRAGDGELLGEKQRDILLRQLAISPADKGYRDLRELFSRAAYQRELQFRLSILKSMEQIGGAKELPTVERLSRGLPNLQSGTRVPKEVRAAARECLPYLQSRALGQQASEQLLRASSAQDAAPDILLRPASRQSDASPEQLLRADTRPELQTNGDTITLTK